MAAFIKSKPKMKKTSQKPYFYFGYNPISDSLGRKTILLNIITRKFKNLLNFNLQDDKQLSKHSVPLQLLMNYVDLAQRVGKLEQMFQQIEVALDIINCSLVTDEKTTCLAHFTVAEKLTRYEEEVHYSRENYYKVMRNGNSRPIQKFKTMFNYYNELYKDNYSIVSSFPAFCHGIITKDTKTIDDYLNLETKQKVEALSSELILKNYPISLLTKGCDRHIRNATSHENRRSFLDNNKKVRLIDINPKTKQVIYNKTFDIKSFENVLRDLMVTILSMKCALVIFNINNIKKINLYAPKKVYDYDLVEKIAFSCAKNSFLDYQSMEVKNKDFVNFIVKVQDRKKVNTVEIKVGPFSKTVSIPEIPHAKQQLARFLQLVFYSTGRSFKKMRVSLIDLNEKLVGELEIDTSNFGIKDVDEFLEKAIKNTVPDGYKLEK